MGCASSRLDVDGGFPMPFKARPAFLHRLDDIKTRRNSQTPTLALSKKELLLHEEDHEINIVNVSSSLPPTSMLATKNSSFSSTIDQEINENIESCVTSEGSQNIINNIKHSSSSSQIKQYCINGTNEKLDIVGTPERKSFQLVTTRVEAPTPPCGTTNSESDEDQLDERMVRKKDDLGFPGSPSFRVYFNDTTNLHDMNVTDKLGPGEVIPEDIAKVDASVSEKVEYPLRQEKKQKTRRSFKKVLPRGGQAAMKNLLNVRSCMSSPHSTHDQTHLLTPKTPAA